MNDQSRRRGGAPLHTIGCANELQSLYFTCCNHDVTLTPVLVCGYGRSGTTALMALFATEPRIAFHREYPFEDRWLTYLAKFSLLTGRLGPSGHLDPVQLTDYGDDHFGPVPWSTPRPADRTTLMPSSSGCFHALWREFSTSARTVDDRLTHYGEKVPEWLPAAIRDDVPDRLGSFLGLKLIPAAAPPAYLESHRTSATVEDSIGRWKREPLCNDVRLATDWFGGS